MTSPSAGLIANRCAGCVRATPRRVCHWERADEPERGQKNKCRHHRAADRAGGIDGVEQRDPRSYFPVGAHGVADQERQRGAHEARGDREHDERHEQVEDGLADGGRVRRRWLVAEHRRVERPGREQQQWNGQRRKGNPGLEQAVRQHRAGDTSGVAPGNGRARWPARPCRQPAPWRPRVRSSRIPARIASATRSGTGARRNPRGKSRRRPRNTRAGAPAPMAARGAAQQTARRRHGARLPGLHGGVSRPSVVFGSRRHVTTL